MTCTGYHRDVRQYRTLTEDCCGLVLGFRRWYSQVPGISDRMAVIAAFGESMEVNSVCLVMEQLPQMAQFIELARTGKLQLPHLEQGGKDGRMFAHGKDAWAIAKVEGLTGQRVRVWWDSMDKWYWGTVTSQTGTCYNIEFDDGAA